MARRDHPDAVGSGSFVAILRYDDGRSRHTTPRWRTYADAERYAQDLAGLPTSTFDDFEVEWSPDPVREMITDANQVRRWKQYWKFRYLEMAHGPREPPHYKAWDGDLQIIDRLARRNK